MPSKWTGQKKKQYNYNLKSLQQRVQHLSLLVQDEQQRVAATHDAQLLLAEAILQHRVMYKFLQPLQGSQLLQQHPSDSPLVVDASWTHMLQLAQASSPLLCRALEATPEEVKRLTAMTPEDIQQIITTKMNQALLLLELLSPERYPEGLISKQPLTVTAEAQGTTGSADSTCVQKLEQAAAELLARLQEFRGLLEEISQITNLLVLHARPALVAAATTHIPTGQASTLPTSHYACAVRRLRLTSRQVQHFRVMLHQYNRITQQQARAGQQLVGMSEDSFSLQTSLSGAPSTQPSTSDGSAGKRQGDSQSTARELQVDGQIRPHTSPGAGDEAQPDIAPLDELLEQYLRDRGDFMAVAEFLVACYPVFAYTPAFVELSAFLQPCDEPRGYINARCCEAAAQAAAVAAEMGYLDTHPFMKQRCAALEAQLQWALQLQEASPSSSN